MEKKLKRKLFLRTMLSALILGGTLPLVVSCVSYYDDFEDNDVKSDVSIIFTNVSQKLSNIMAQYKNIEDLAGNMESKEIMSEINKLFPLLDSTMDITSKDIKYANDNGNKSLLKDVLKSLIKRYKSRVIQNNITKSINLLNTKISDSGRTEYIQNYPFEESLIRLTIALPFLNLNEEETFQFQSLINDFEIRQLDAFNKFKDDDLSEKRYNELVAKSKSMFKALSLKNYDDSNLQTQWKKSLSAIAFSDELDNVNSEKWLPNTTRDELIEVIYKILNSTSVDEDLNIYEKFRTFSAKQKSGFLENAKEFTHLKLYSEILESIKNKSELENFKSETFQAKYDILLAEITYSPQQKIEIADKFNSPFFNKISDPNSENAYKIDSNIIKQNFNDIVDKFHNFNFKTILPSDPIESFNSLSQNRAPLEINTNIKFFYSRHFENLINEFLSTPEVKQAIESFADEETKAELIKISRGGDPRVITEMMPSLWVFVALELWKVGFNYSDSIVLSKIFGLELENRIYPYEVNIT